MVEHSVTITHSFESPGGSGIVACIDSARDEITISFQFRRGEAWVELEPKDIAEIGKLFGLMANHIPEIAELRDLFTEAGKMISH